MKLSLQKSGAVLLSAISVWCMLLSPRSVVAQDHVVPLSELETNLRSAGEVRAKNIADIERVLSLPAAQKELAKANVNQQQVRKAVSLLNDQELSRLADRARAAEQDVQGGFIVGLLALIGLIVVIIIVVSLVR